MRAAGSLPVVSGSTLTTSAVVVLFRLGFGWLIGRRWLLVVTGTGDEHRITLMRYRMSQGAVRVAATPGPWLDDLDTKSVATIHAAPGPLAVTARRESGEVVFERTGRPSPPVIVPDLNWVLPATVLVLWMMRRTRRYCARHG